MNTVRRFPMRRPRGLRHRIRPRYRGPSFNRIIPNLMTVAGLCAGLTAMRFALEGHFDAAAIAIAIAGVIDGLDGRLARLLKATSRFGAEFDSLSDFACFGIAPGFTLYQWSLQRMGGTGYAVCVLFAVCMALRLARFNAMLETPDRPAYTANFFTGVPAPAGAGLVLFPLFLGLEADPCTWNGCPPWPATRCCARPSWSAPPSCWSHRCRSGVSKTSRSPPISCCPFFWAPASSSP